MNKKILILGSIVLVAIGAVIAFFLLKDKEENKVTDAMKFHEAYPKVPEDNMFVYRSAEEIVKILENGTGIVFLGFDTCIWCQEYVPMLYEVAKAEEIEKIYYFNLYEDRLNNTEAYQKMVAILEEYLHFDSEGNPRIMVPDVTFIYQGEIVGHNNESSTLSTAKDGTPEEWWTDERRLALKEEIKSYIDELYAVGCDKGCND